MEIPTTTGDLSSHIPTDRVRGECIGQASRSLECSGILRALCVHAAWALSHFLVVLSRPCSPFDFRSIHPFTTNTATSATAGCPVQSILPLSIHLSILPFPAPSLPPSLPRSRSSLSWICPCRRRRLWLLPPPPPRNKPASARRSSVGREGGRRSESAAAEDARRERGQPSRKQQL